MLVNGTASDAQNSRTQQGDQQRTSKSPQEFYQHRNRLRHVMHVMHMIHVVACFVVSLLRRLTRYPPKRPVATSMMLSLRGGRPRASCLRIAGQI